MAASKAPTHVPIVDVETLIAAAGFSIATMIVLVVYSFVAGCVVGLVGCWLAVTARTPARALWASRLISVGLGLFAGPAVYLSFALAHIIDS